jgi:hypothetical protein
MIHKLTCRFHWKCELTRLFRACHVARFVVVAHALDFGATLVGNAVALPLTLTNASAMPQKFAFPRVPEGFAVDPGASDGFGLLLPGASAALTVVFTPPAPGRYAARLQCLTSLNSAFDVPLLGEGDAGEVRAWEVSV